ncbi:MAG: ATPase, T2SS/T4P/T4SS family [Candidatus Hadarchaeaceae archaeon]
MMGCDRSMVEVGAERVMKFKCGDCRGGASVEKSSACMKGVLEALTEENNVDVVVLSGIYEHEYSGTGLRALKEVADVLNEMREWTLVNLVFGSCRRCEASRETQVRRILEELSAEPLAGYHRLKELFYTMNAKKERGAKSCQACRSNFIEKSLKPLLSSLEGSALLKAVKIGLKYSEILQPLIKPCFLTSRVKMEPPTGCELIDSYEIESGEVKIYRLPDQLQNLYFFIPPEYRLTHDKIKILQYARQGIVDNHHNLDCDLLQVRKQIVRLGERLMIEKSVKEKIQVSREEIKNLALSLSRFTAGMGLLEYLLSDAKVQDIYIDAPVGRTPVHLLHRDYDECLTNIFITPDDACSLISRFRAISGRPFSEADPILDLNLGEIRIAAIGPPLSPNGIAFSFRRHKPTPWTLPQFIQEKFLTPYAAGLLSLLVDSQVSLLIAGNRGAGKTSLLGALMLEILPKFRIITIEDTRELMVGMLRDLGFKIQSLQVQSSVSGVKNELSAEEALRTALRLGDSVLVIGEVRGEEARVLYEAMRVGAAGNSVMGTIHGATAQDVFERVVHDLGIAPSSFKATEAVVVAAPIRRRGGVARVRRLVQIAEVRRNWHHDPTAEGGFLPLMSYDYSRDCLRPTRILLSRRSELIARIARKWGSEPLQVMRNLEFRAKVQGDLVNEAAMGRPQLLEAPFVLRANLTWHSFFEEQLKHGNVDYRQLYQKWREWLNSAKEQAA